MDTKIVQTVELGDKDFRITAKGPFDDKDARGYVPSPESEQIRVLLPTFEGPLDLLLYLIRKHSMDIFDIPIMSITEKYLGAMNELHKLDLDHAGEFIAMAATLAQIKSRLLLPKEEMPEEIEEGEGLDSREELMRRLIEYKRFKEAAAHLMNHEQLGKDVFSRSNFIEQNDVIFSDDILNRPAVMPIEPFQLIELFVKAIEKGEPKTSHAIELEQVSVRARITELMELCRIRSTLFFDDALAFFGQKNARNQIVTFMSILEMAKLRVLKIGQDEHFGEILLSAVADNLSIDKENLLEDLFEEYE